jgi:hypothetical protein
MTKSQLAERILRNFGAPIIKVELNMEHIYDAIDYARNKYIKWAVGNATQEVYFTIALSAYQYIYDMPVGVTEVLSYYFGGVSGGINTLFTVDNYLYSQGMFDSLINTSGEYTLVSYHIVRDFLESLQRYTPDAYNFKYHPYTNQLEIQPPPPSGGSLTYTPTYKDANCNVITGEEVTIDSPGWILIRSYMLTGSSISNYCTDATVRKEVYENLYDGEWIIDFATAYSKKTLGIIRRKFNSFGSLGNQGIALDGGEMISEAEAEMERLLEALKKEEVYEGYGIVIG